MSAESDLITSLAANATLTAVVSTRIEPAPRREGQTAPDITWHVITRTFEQPIARTIAGTRTHYQFDCWASSASNTIGAEAIAAALKTALLAYTTSAHDLTFIGEYDIPEPLETGLVHRALTVAILT